MRSNRSPRRPQTQLLANRDVLTKLNPVIRKKVKSKQSNAQIPHEWDESQAQAYRLLAGPRINKYFESDSHNTLNTLSTKSPKQLKQEEKEKLLSKLVPSRLKTPATPLQVSADNIDQMNYPSDLLVQVFPTDQRPKFDLLSRQANRPKTQHFHTKKILLSPINTINIVKPLTNIQKIPSTGSKNQINLNLSDLKPQTSSSELPCSDYEFEEEEEEFDNKSENAENNECENEHEENVPKVNEDHEETVFNQAEIDRENKRRLLMIKFEEKSKQRKRKETIQLRKYFFALRCWAHYKINARIKSKFIVDVSQTQKLLCDFRNWNFYVKKVLILRKLKADFIEEHKKSVVLQYWTKMINIARKSIINAGKASRYLYKRNLESKKLILDELHIVAHCKQVCRRETHKYFRYYSSIDDKDRKYYTQISNDYYNKKRKLNILALHHNFIKKCAICIEEWKIFVKDRKHDKKQIGYCNSSKIRIMFRKWYENYRSHFHDRIMLDIRTSFSTFQEKSNKTQRESSEQVEKTVMIQLLRDKQILKAKLSQFDRLSTNHFESVQKRRNMRNQIDTLTQNYFSRQEELMLIDFNKSSEESHRKVREVRKQLAEGFLYHMGRAIHSFDNQIVGRSYCLSFRVLSEPLVNKAVNYFYEKKHVKQLLKSAALQSKTLKTAVHCSKLFFYGKSWGILTKYIESVNSKRTEGLMKIIRRRTSILQLFPYFNWVEILPVRPPRPLKEVEQMYKDLPLVSIQRKVARERVHHVNVRMILMRRKILRNFIRAYASYVQVKIARREVINLFRKRESLKLVVRAFYGLKTNWDKTTPRENSLNSQELIIRSDINAWLRHFFRARTYQKKLTKKVPLS